MHAGHCRIFSRHQSSRFAKARFGGRDDPAPAFRLVATAPSCLRRYCSILSSSLPLHPVYVSPTHRSLGALCAVCFCPVVLTAPLAVLRRGPCTVAEPVGARKRPNAVYSRDCLHTRGGHITSRAGSAVLCDIAPQNSKNAMNPIAHNEPGTRIERQRTR